LCAFLAILLLIIFSSYLSKINKLSLLTLDHFLMREIGGFGYNNCKALVPKL